MTSLYYSIRRLRHYTRACWHRLTRGYTDWEWYELRTSAARYILPRLKHLAEHTNGMLCIDYEKLGLYSENKWSKEDEARGLAESARNLGDMIYAMERLAYEERYYDVVVDEERIQRGCRLIGEHFQGLWD